MINNTTNFICESVLNKNLPIAKSRWRKSIMFAFCLIMGFTHQTTNAQVPTTCFEIQSILVAACGTPEGENEMVRFIVGPNDLPLSLLVVNWPNVNNAFLGICQNPQTAANVAAINSAIGGCGFVQEPVGGILPAGSTVVLVTSTNMNPAFNSFAGLTDTLIMIFQCSGNTSGHFKNYGTTGTLTRTLSMLVDACGDSVTYHIDSLKMQSGAIGDEDGATVLFDFPGNATYTNPGCEAPINSLFATLSADSTSACAGSTINLSAVISNSNYSSYFWSGGAGSYGNLASLNTTYQTNSTFIGIDNLTFNIVGNCNDTISSSFQLQINPCAIGIKEQNDEASIAIFPNPVLDECSITASKFANALLTICDVEGRVIIQQYFYGKSNISLAALSAGVYVLEIRSNTGASSKIKLVKE